jgi:LacI family transcriptional regulator
MADVAAEAQCSQATVSVVLSPNSKIKISDATRERILKIADSLGYRAESVPAARLKQMREFVVIFDDLTVCPEAVIAADGVREATWETGDIVAVYNCHADEKMEARTIETVLQRPVAGLIYATARTRSVVLPEALRTAGVPVILLNCYSRDRSVPAVVPADIAGGNRAAELLISHGHRRIAHITGEGWMEVSRDRLRGYREALATHDISFDPSLVREGNWQLSSGYEATKALMALERPPTAIFCANDRMAMGCYEALKELGLRIPEDVSVVGFDDDELASHLFPKLTTLKFPRHLMGTWAAECAYEMDVAEEESYRVVKLECELIERDSVAACPPPDVATGR